MLAFTNGLPQRRQNFRMGALIAAHRLQNKSPAFSSRVGGSPGFGGAFARSALDSASGVGSSTRSPVHPRKAPHQPQKASPGWFACPQSLQ